MASVYTNLYYNQPVIVLDTTASTPTSGSLLLYGGFTARGDATILGNITAGGLFTPTSTISNLVTTNISSGQFSVNQLSSINITTSNITVDTQLYVPLATITNLVATNITSGQFAVDQFVSTNITTSTQAPATTSTPLVLDRFQQLIVRYPVYTLEQVL